MLDDIYNVSEITVSYKPDFKISSRPKITTSKNSEVIFRKYWLDDLNLYESSFLLLLNNGNNVLGLVKIGSGGVDCCPMDIYKVLQIALKCNATGIILAHNHPGGTLRPSPADISTTEKIFEGAKMIHIRLLDHLILTEDSYYSFADEGLL
ncbi:RadC-like JAB domain-containing protein [Pedobacter terrae]|uniref:RadC-like JAB domain-containing protein n=1 Tax=Pedobacter terrae TaxID=405671 RepID=A0A1G7W7T4_9SPHI|nr:JAB domain-containing protein [Pedobacter terrae]SDG67973.1 RadC-like JAB domain-containing protein [Pedobacter terrae]